MVNPSHNIDVNQQIQQMNRALKGATQFKQGQGKVPRYIVIQGGQIGLTTSKKLASGKNELYGFINELSKSAIKDTSVSRDSLQQLSNLLSNYVRISQPKGRVGKLMQALRDKIWPANKRNVESAFDLLTNKLSDYGTKQVTDLNTWSKIDKKQTYAQYAEGELRKKVEAETDLNAFDLLSAQKKPSLTQVVSGFKNQFQKNVTVSFAGQRIALTFLQQQVANVLDDLYGEVQKKKLTPDQAIEQFLPRFKEAVIKHNQVTLEFDREDFKEIMGKAVKGGKGKIPDLPSDDKIKQLIKEYNDGTWVEEKDESGEVIPRTYTYDQLNSQLKDEFLDSSVEILNSPQCRGVLKRFFEAWQ